MNIILTFILLHYTSSFAPIPPLLTKKYLVLDDGIRSLHDCSSQSLYMNRNSENIDDDMDYDGDEEVDWRAFRAQLVSQERSTLSDDSNIIPSDGKRANDIPPVESWAYESGMTIEQGSVIVNHPPTDSQEFGFSLGRQWLHKAVILVLEHEDSIYKDTYSKGIILNRPTDLILLENDIMNDENDINFTIETESHETPMRQEQEGWRIWYGGDEFGIHNEDPKFYCLHTLSRCKQAKAVSRKVMKDIYFTPFQSARDLVRDGVANYTDFWCFAGFVQWDIEDLLEDVSNEHYHVMSTDSTTVKKALRFLNGGVGAKVQDCGLRVWSMMIDLIGRCVFDDGLDHCGNTPDGTFDDQMLKEWVNRYLVFSGESTMVADEDDFELPLITVNIEPGTLIRGTSKGTPFLLSEQEFHKSIILIIQDDAELSVGVLLNHPSSKCYHLSGTSRTSLPLRFGGSFGGPLGFPTSAMEDEPLFCLHMSPTLREMGVGSPVGQSFPDLIWKCTLNDAVDAMNKNLAEADDFMMIDGFYVWPKSLDEAENVRGGVWEEIKEEKYEIVPFALTQDVWNTLKKQTVLSEENLARNFEVSNSAWLKAKFGSTSTELNSHTHESSQGNRMKLGDRALMTWMKAYLLP